MIYNLRFASLKPLIIRYSMFYNYRKSSMKHKNIDSNVEKLSHKVQNQYPEILLFKYDIYHINSCRMR